MSIKVVLQCKKYFINNKIFKTVYKVQTTTQAEIKLDLLLVFNKNWYIKNIVTK